jgi:RNA polymerase sigma factor (sigma-70 family)
MQDGENHAFAGSTNDSWRTWLITGARRSPVDRRRMRGAHRGLKKMLVDGMSNGEDRPHAWKDFSGAMVRHAVDEAMRTLPAVDKQVVKLAYFGGYTNRAIAAEVGLTEGTVQRHLQRALGVISDYIQQRRALGRRAMYGLAIWLSGRWLTDSAQHVVQAAAVAGVTAIIAAQAAPSFAPEAPSNSQSEQATASATVPVTAAAPGELPAVDLAAVSSVDHNAVDGRHLVVLARHEVREHRVVAHRVP